MATVTGTSSRVILDSRGNNTLEVDVMLSDGTVGRASVPAGASTGIHEAYKIEDMAQCRRNVETLGAQLIGQDPAQQQRVDLLLLQADGSENKTNLGGNVLLALSLATCHAAAQSQKIPLFQHIHHIAGLGNELRMPNPMFNILNGGKHADNALEMQEFMVVPTPEVRPYHEQVAIGQKVFKTLKAMLQKLGHSTAVGDEGGFAPRLNSNAEAIEIIVEAIEEAGYAPKTDVSIALDVAASAIPDLTTLTYPLDPLGFYEKLVTDYPIIAIEDPLGEDDWQGWSSLTAKIGSHILLVGDDLYTSNPKRFKEGIDRHAGNSIMIKPDQVGTLTETFQTIRLARSANLPYGISHRAGETESTFIADLAVGTGALFIKAGAPSRGERVAKYNQLLRIEEQLERQQ